MDAKHEDIEGLEMVEHDEVDEILQDGIPGTHISLIF